MSKYDAPPLYRIMSLEDKKLLNSPNVEITNALLDKVEVVSQNSRIYIVGDPTYQNTYYNSEKFVGRSEQRGEKSKHVIMR